MLYRGIPITDTPYKAGTYVHYTKNYHGSLLTLLTRENFLMDREELLKRK